MSHIATRTSEPGELFSWYSFGRKPCRTSFPHQLPAQAQIGGTPREASPVDWSGAAAPGDRLALPSIIRRAQQCRHRSE